MIKYRYNKTIDYFEIDPLYLKEGLIYACNNGYKKIRIFSLNTKQNSTILDLAPFKNKSFVNSLMISDDFKIKKTLNTETLYSLVNLKEFSCDQNIKIDFSFLKQLKTLTLKYSRNFTNLNQLKAVSKFSLRSFNEEDCLLISEMENIRNLKLQGSYSTLDGIMKLKNLETLRLIHSPKIIDISEINELEKLSSLYIEKCKRISDVDFLQKNNSIEELFISELNSLSFIPMMKKLKMVSFWTVKDGNLEPLLNSLTLKNVYFYPNRKFYNYKLQEILLKLTLK